MKLTTKLILPAVLIFALSLTGCPQASTNPGENSGTNPAVPSNPNELVEADVLAAFGLQRGSVTASAAAKKIATGAPASGITFTERTAVSYDDQAGTFTVKVKGIKNGKPFEKELTFSGFSNPYAANPQSMDTTGGKGELKLDEGIEHNHSIEKYTGKANLNIANFFQAPLTFSLVNGTSITRGDFPGYKLNATLVQEGND
ncbi:MAG: lipoprotein 17-related variable surface protein, partial [Treponema lecithinolyticum]|uniref:lipoprotein 17-related variable surface protein n=1 Tax=Treponema lecithinolyticum TaxID=53418 RepID=UPI003FA26B51